MSKRISILAVLAGILLAVAPQTARAQSDSMGNVDIKECPPYNPPSISIVLNSGRMMQSQTKTAFQLAREKAVKYKVKMPMRQGNIGSAQLRPEIKIMAETYPDMGCLAVTSIDVQVALDHKVELATDYKAGTCMQSEFFNLENELAQQDEEMANSEILSMRQGLRQEIGTNYVYGPVHGVNLDQAKLDKIKEIEAMIQTRVKALNEKLDKIRLESDTPDLFADIEKDCAGGVTPSKKKQ